MSEQAPDGTPPVSLCMIVRDEQDVLERCLRSATTYVREIVVVDTGSKDATRGTALRAGARLLTHRWAESFADARNVALEAARQPYVLVLDADEWIESGPSPRELARRLEASAEEAFTVEIADRLDGGASRRYPLVRLFRNRLEHRYEGTFHEQVTPSIARRLGLEFVQAAPSGLVVGHDGYLAARRRDRGKAGRNLELLRREVERHPDDRAARYFLARERIPVKNGRAVPGGHVHEALDHLRWLAGHPATLTPALERDALRLHGAALLVQGDASAAKRVLERAGSGVGVELLRADADLLLGTSEPERVHRALGRIRGCYGRGDEGDAPFTEPALAGAVARSRAAEALARLERLAEAGDEARRATQMTGGGAAPWNALAVVERASGNRAGAIKAYVQGIQADDMDPWTWAGMGEAVFDLGDPDGAVSALRNAATLAPGWDAVDEALAAAMFVGGRVSEVRREFEARDRWGQGAAARAALLVATLLETGGAPAERDESVRSAVEGLLQRIGQSGGRDLLSRLAALRSRD